MHRKIDDNSTDTTLWSGRHRLAVSLRVSKAHPDMFPNVLLTPAQAEEILAELGDEDDGK